MLGSPQCQKGFRLDEERDRCAAEDFSRSSIEDLGCLFAALHGSRLQYFEPFSGLSLRGGTPIERTERKHSAVLTSPQTAVNSDGASGILVIQFGGAGAPAKAKVVPNYAVFVSIEPGALPFAGEEVMP